MSAGSPLVDVHVHLYPTVDAGQQAKADYEIWEYGLDPGVRFDGACGVIEELDDRYGAQGFDHAVVLQLFDVAAARADYLQRLYPGAGPGPVHGATVPAEVDEALSTALMAGNSWIVAAAASRPGITAYVGVDPAVLSPVQIRSHLADMAGQGARGVKLHPVAQRYEPGDDRLAVVYDSCCELDLVVLSHAGPGHRAGASARPREFATVLAQWPSLRLVLAHLGGAAFSEAAALAEDFPQVAFDLSEIIEWTGAPNAPSRHQLAEVIHQIGADRVMLGSDFPWYDPAVTADKVAGLPHLGPAERAALLGETAVGLLGLDLGS